MSVGEIDKRALVKINRRPRLKKKMEKKKMKVKMKKWQILMVTVMALLLAVLSPVAAMAQSHDVDVESSKPKIKGSLAIVAPRMSFVGQEIAMTVFLRADQEPFPSAGVWALTQDEADTLRAEIEALREEGSLSPEMDYEEMVGDRGVFLGRTGGDGKIYHTFTESDGYFLVAVKKWYLPGFTRLHVRDMPRALGIEAPRRAAPGAEITITAFQRITNDPVEDAGIWALTRNELETLKSELQALRQDTSTAAEEKDYEAVVSVYGFLLGRTDEDGELDHAFEEAGGYLLVAVKRGYHPGFAPIGVYDIPNALAIRVPWVVPEGKEVTMAVFDRINQNPVEDAGVWVLTRDRMEVLREELQALKEDARITADERDYEALVGIHGDFIGRTDEDGELNHTFDEVGAYLLVAVKKSYIPGFAPVFVRGAPDQSMVPDVNRVPAQDEQIAEEEEQILEDEQGT